LLTMVAFGPSYYAPGNSHWIMHNLDAAGKWFHRSKARWSNISS
jgi:hypothetical protein